MRRIAVILPVLGTLLAASADTINFDDQAAGTVITNQYAGVTFSTIAGQQNQVHAFSNGGTSPPNILCTADLGGNINCLNPTTVEFSPGVDNLTFLAVEPNAAGIVASIDIYQGNVYTTTFNLNGLNGAGNVLIDFSAFPNITKIDILGPGGSGFLDESGNGIGWDDFSYKFVPEPATALLLIAGAVGLIRRRAR
ncbi:MAG: hypothetical protein CHACPFDD_02949 [Phycisphaerae bacterium]|nr:hypothetical protein [Phycisphaerae bacterium]